MTCGWRVGMTKIVVQITRVRRIPHPCPRTMLPIINPIPLYLIWDLWHSPAPLRFCSYWPTNLGMCGDNLTSKRRRFSKHCRLFHQRPVLLGWKFCLERNFPHPSSSLYKTPATVPSSQGVLMCPKPGPSRGICEGIIYGTNPKSLTKLLGRRWRKAVVNLPYKRVP